MFNLFWLCSRPKSPLKAETTICWLLKLYGNFLTTSKMFQKWNIKYFVDSHQVGGVVVTSFSSHLPPPHEHQRTWAQEKAGLSPWVTGCHVACVISRRAANGILWFWYFDKTCEDQRGKVTDSVWSSDIFVVCVWCFYSKCVNNKYLGKNP